MNKQQLDTLRAARDTAYENWHPTPHFGNGMREYIAAARAYQRAVFAAALDSPNLDPADRPAFTAWAKAEPYTASAHYCNSLAKWEAAAQV